MTQSFTVKECLHGYTNEALAAICERWRARGGSKADCIRAVDTALRDPLHVEAALARIAPAEQRLLALVAQRGKVSVNDVLAVPGLFANGSVNQMVANLAQYGFVLACPEERAGSFTFTDLAARGLDRSGPSLLVPEPVAQMLPPPPQLGISLPAQAADAEPDRPPLQDRATSVFLETLRLVDLVGPRITSAGMLHKKDTQRMLELAREAGVAAEEYELAFSAARVMGCVAPEDGRFVTTSEANAWAESPRHERVRAMFDAYLRSEDLPDVRLFFPEMFAALEEHLPAGSLRRTYHKTLLAIVLSEQPVHVWFKVNDFIETIRRLDPNIFFLEERWRAIHSHARDVTAAWKNRTWDTHERRFLEWFLRGYLTDLGMVQTGDGGTYFRLTPAGLYALGSGDAPSGEDAAQSDALIVQPDFEIVAFLDRCTPRLRRKLDTFCELVRPGMASTYLITRDSVYRGIRAGRSPEDFLRLLEDHSAKGIPDNVRTQFATWQRKVQSIAVRTNCRLVECLDAKDAADYAARSGGRLIGSHFVLIEADPPEVEATLDYVRPVPPSVVQEEGLRLRAPWEKANLFTERRLRDVADVRREPNGDIVATLSQERVDGFEDWGLLVAQLESLTAAPLAARYKMALRTWAGETHPAQSRTASLLRFEDEESCHAVMEMPGVAELVEGRLGLFTLVVRQGRLAKLKKLLKEHGIPVSATKRPFDDGAPSDWAAQWAEEQVEPEQEDAAGDTPAPSGKCETEETPNLPYYSPRIIRELLEDAIARRRPVLIQYQSAWSGSVSVRRVNPVAIDLVGPSPSLTGYCHQHGGARAFKLSRITGIRVLDEETF